MKEAERRNGNSGYRFTRVYIYHTTKKPWDKLNLEKDKFEWDVTKFLFVSSVPVTQPMVEKHYKECPEIHNGDTVNKKIKKKEFPFSWYHIYDSVPLTEYDIKLLQMCMGNRMIHFL